MKKIKLADMNRVYSMEWSLVNGKAHNICGSWHDHGKITGETELWEQQVGLFPSTVTPLENGLRFYYYYHISMTPYCPNLALMEMDNGGNIRKYPLTINKNSYFSLHNVVDGGHPIQANVVKISQNCYRMYFWLHQLPQRCRFMVAESSNGLNFKVLDIPPVLFHWANNYEAHSGKISAAKLVNDATAVYRLADGTWELYTASCVTVNEGSKRFFRADVGTGAVGAYRFIQRYSSKDGLTWDDEIPQIVLLPDDKDGPQLQFYHLTVAYLKNDKRIGFAGFYEVDKQMMGMEIVHSDDGVYWERPFKRNCFPHRRNEFFYGVYPPHNFLMENDRIVMFYTGTNSMHNLSTFKGEKSMNVIGQASIDSRRILGRRIDGCVLSPALRLLKKEFIIHISDDIHAPQVELLDIFGEKEIGKVDTFVADGRLHLAIPDVLSSTYGRLKLFGRFDLFDLE